MSRILRVIESFTDLVNLAKVKDRGAAVVLDLSEVTLSVRAVVVISMEVFVFMTMAPSTTWVSAFVSMLSVPMILVVLPVFAKIARDFLELYRK